MKIKVQSIIICCILIGLTIIINELLKKQTIAIIGAMEEEINKVNNNLINQRTIQTGGFKITKGIIGKNKIILTKSGVGKVSAATSTQFIIDKYRPDYIINTGIAGSLTDTLKAGDIILAEKLVQHDFDLTAFGSPKGYIDNGINPDKPTIFYSDKYLIEKFKKELNVDGNNVIIKIGTIATGDIFVNNENQKEEIRKEFNADAIDMESAAIAQTAERNNIPYIVIRTISDDKKNSEKEYKQNKNNAAEQSAEKIVFLLKNKEKNKI